VQMRQVNLSTCFGVQVLQLRLSKMMEELRCNGTSNIPIRCEFYRQMEIEKGDTTRRNFQKLSFRVFVNGFVLATDFTGNTEIRRG
jgi:hypothetical protein